MLVLTPGEKPQAITRCCCCFEWKSIAQSGIPFEYCVTSEVFEAMINRGSKVEEEEMITPAPSASTPNALSGLRAVVVVVARPGFGPQTEMIFFGRVNGKDHVESYRIIAAGPVLGEWPWIITFLVCQGIVNVFSTHFFPLWCSSIVSFAFISW